ncbi:MAG: hypothetical protein AMXMBFR66_13380 [Pseudomonadota bacterium]|nr:HigA family addiction module antidote protein [Rubrivivax sp.]
MSRILPPSIVPPAGMRSRRPVHPGHFLEHHYLRPLGITQTETARRLGVSRRRVNELVLGKRAMSPDTAIRCAQAFGLPASAWLTMQAEWDAWQTWQAMRAVRHPRLPAAPARA